MLTGQLSAIGGLTGSINAVGSLIGRLSTAARLSGSISGTSQMLGVLTAAATLNGILTVPRALNVEEYMGPYEFSPSQQAQTINIQYKTAMQNITINPIPENYGLITWNGSALTVS